MVRYIIFLLVLTSCGPAIPPGMSFIGFSNGQEEAVLHAMSLIPNLITDIQFSRLDPSSPYAGTACLDCDPCYIRLHPYLPTEYYTTVVWHEYGHCVGMQHSDVGIMAPMVYHLTFYSEDDILDFKESLIWTWNN